MLAISLAHAVLAGAKAMEELLVSPYGPFVALEGGEIADRTGHIRLQMLADRGEGKLTAVEFLEDADAREQSRKSASGCASTLRARTSTATVCSLI